MTTYCVTITETLSRDIFIEAENEDEAYEKADTMYSEGEVVLDSDDFCDVDFNIYYCPNEQEN